MCKKNLQKIKNAQKITGFSRNKNESVSKTLKLKENLDACVIARTEGKA